MLQRYETPIREDLARELFDFWDTRFSGLKTPTYPSGSSSAKKPITTVTSSSSNETAIH